MDTIKLTLLLRPALARSKELSMDEEVYNARGELSDGYDCFWTKLLVACLVFYLSAALVVAIVLMGRAPTANKQDDASHDAPLRLLGRI